MRKLRNQWGDRNPQMSKPESFGLWNWIMLMAFAMIGAIITVGMSWA